MEIYDHEIKSVKIKTLAGTEVTIEGNLDFIDLWSKVNDIMWHYKHRRRDRHDNL